MHTYLIKTEFIFVLRIITWVSQEFLGVSPLSLIHLLAAITRWTGSCSQAFYMPLEEEGNEPMIKAINKKIVETDCAIRKIKMVPWVTG